MLMRCASLNEPWSTSERDISALTNGRGLSLPSSARHAIAKSLGWEAMRSSSILWLSCTTVLPFIEEVSPACSNTAISSGPSKESPSG